MRLVIWLNVGCLFVGFLVFASLSIRMLSSFDIPPLDDREKEYQEENRQLIEQQVEAERYNVPEKEIEQIRAKRRVVIRHYLDYNKSLLHGELIDFCASQKR